MPLLRSEKLVEDSLYALSMYYASTLSAQMVKTNENLWSLLLLVALLALQMRLEEALAAAAEGRAGLFWRVAEQASSVVSRTLAFLVLHFVVHVTAQESTTPDVLWQERFVLPVLLLLLLSLAVVSSRPPAAGAKKKCPRVP
jgi:hypothetical protein